MDVKTLTARQWERLIDHVRRHPPRPSDDLTTWRLRCSNAAGFIRSTIIDPLLDEACDMARVDTWHAWTKKTPAQVDNSAELADTIVPPPPAITGTNEVQNAGD